MKIEIEDCEFKVEKDGMYTVHHRPTGRCVSCVKGNATEDEVFKELQLSINRLEELGLLDQRKGVGEIIIRDDGLAS